MNWNRGVEILWESRVSGWIGLGEMVDLLTSGITKGELEEFAGALIEWVELSPAPLLLED
jgi:hypothetical protein